mgnify:CR=1 FL=1
MNLITILLRILSNPYRLVTDLRNRLFNIGILNTYASSIPVISIGNLSMGGTGKTPHVAYLIEQFITKNTAVISRGYKRKSTGLIEGNHQTHTVRELGDEPMELLQLFHGPKFKMIVESSRKKALKYIEAQQSKTDLIILDDGYQHRYVHRDLNILLTDYNKPFFQDDIIPLGTLREIKENANRADVILVTKCPNNISEKIQNDFSSQISNYSTAKTFFTTIEYRGLINSNDELEQIDKTKKYLLITGIANPQPIYEYLAENKIHFAAKKYSDHHSFSKKEIQYIIKKSENCEAIITTEKDWMRLKETNLAEAISIEVLRLSIGIKFVDSEQDNTFNKLTKSLLD